MERQYVNVLNADDTYKFMVGFAKLKTIDQKIIMFLHEKDYKYTGTYTQLCNDMGYQDSYTSEVNRSCKRLESYGIITIKNPKIWYIRDMFLVEDWIAKVTALGKEKGYVFKESIHTDAEQTG